MKTKLLLGLAGPALAAAFAASSPAAAAILPAPNCGTVAGTNCLVFSDFTVYSLALLNLQAGAGTIGPGDPFQVSTNGIDLQNAIVINTGVGGQGSVNTDQIGGGLVDNAYDNPSLGGPGLSNFVGGAGNQGAQGANIPNNSNSTWDISVAALNTYLNGGQLEFYFNLNQTNSQQTTYLNTPQDALGWMSVTLSDSTGAHAPLTFFLNGNNCTGTIGLPGSGACDPSQSVAQSISPGNSDILPTGEEWAYIHGQICADPSGALIGFGACTGPGITINQNLGANTAAFGLVSYTLNSWLNSGFYDKMSVDLRMAAQTNGYEQLIILAGPRVNIPEPFTIGLFGAGLIGAGLLRRRNRKA